MAQIGAVVPADQPVDGIGRDAADAAVNANATANTSAVPNANAVYLAAANAVNAANPNRAGNAATNANGNAADVSAAATAVRNAHASPNVSAAANASHAHAHAHANSAKYAATPRRWLVLAAAAMLNVSINALWVSFSPIASDVAVYYGQTSDRVNVLSAVGLVIGLPLSLSATWMVERLGLRFVMVSAGVTAFIGANIRLFSSLDIFDISLENRFTMLIVSQVFVGLGNPLAFCIPTKVGHDWFPPNQAPIAGGLITMSFVLGICLGFGLAPFFVTRPDLVPLIHQIYYPFSVIAFCLSVFTVTSSKPAIPPSESAAQVKDPMPYLTCMRLLLTNRNFLVVMFSCGGAIGYFNNMITLYQQITCTRGYDEQFTAACIVCVLSSGFVGGIVATFVAHRSGSFLATARVYFALAPLLVIALLVAMTMPYMNGLILTLDVLTGLIGFPIMPLCFHLCFEVCYPVDPAASLSLIYFSSQIQFAAMTAIAGVTTSDLPPDLKEIETCSRRSTGADSFEVEAREHVTFVYIMCGIFVLLAGTFVLFFRPKASEGRDEGRDFRSLARTSSQCTADDYGSCKGDTKTNKE